MGSGEARALHKKTGKKVVMGAGKPYWSEVFDHNPAMAKDPSKDTVWCHNFPGSRPYIAKIEQDHFVFNEDYRAPYGEIFLTEAEKEWASKQISGDYIVVEPDIKDDAKHLYLGRNKAWNGWAELLKTDLPWVQLGIKAPKTRQVRTEGIRHALAVLAGAKLFVGTDGALHHAAAALGVPAVVLWGGLVSPKILGYPTHINIWNGAKSCGTHNRICPHCREAMDSISVEQVRKHL
jgi:hypothetical protein